MSNRRKIIIDTDAGVDDAVALYLALAYHVKHSENLDIVAITAVVGNTDVDHVCRNVYLVLDSIEDPSTKNIPVFKGATKPLVHEYVRSETPFFGEDGFGNYKISKEKHGKHKIKQRLSEEPAAVALVNLARKWKHELTVIALGPLTNIAMAVNLDPDFSKNLQKLVIMGGNTRAVGNIRPCAEFNFFVDPEAAFVVIGAEWNSNPVVVPLEACKDAMSDLSWRQNVLGNLECSSVKLLNSIEAPLFHRYQKDYGTWVSPDAIAMAAYLNPKIVLRETVKYCNVELQGFLTRGQMVVDYNEVTQKPPNASIIEKVDKDALEETMLMCFKDLLKFT